MLARVLRRDGGRRQLQVAADYLGDVLDRYALVGDRVERGAGRRTLEREAEQACGIEPVHGGPSVAPVADIARYAFSRAIATSRATKPLSPSPWFVGGSRTTHERTPRVASDRTNSPVSRRALVPLAAEAPASVSCPSRSVATRPGVRRASRGDDQRSIRARRAPRRMLSTAQTIRVGSALEIPGEREVVLEREMDHAVRCAGGVCAGPRGRRACRDGLRPGRGEGAAEASERASPTT